MLIEGQIATVIWNNGNKNWYINKGYSFTKMRKEFNVNVEDLTNSAQNKVNFICDYCNNPFEKEWFVVYKSTQTNKKHSCNECSKIKMLETKKLTNTLYTSKMKKIHVSQRLSLDYLQSIFESKGYILISNEYKNNKDNLSFICKVHENIGVQKTTAIRLRRNNHNCIQCQKEDNLLKEKEKIDNLDIIDVYKQVLSGEAKCFPNKFFKFKSLSDLKELLLYFVSYAKKKEGCIEVELFTQEIFYKYKLSSLFQMYSIFEIVDTAFPDKYVPWDLTGVPPHYWDSEENIMFASRWFYNKLYEHNYISNDEEILEIRDFGTLFKKYKLDGLYYSKFDSSHCKFWNYLFPNRWYEWEFKLTQKHYWESQENRIKGLRELIENRLAIPKDDIPEKFNYSFLIKEHRKFSAICDTYYNSDLTLWIEECYPNYFCKEDFYNTVGKDGTVLDSKHEKEIHNLLIDNCINLQYFENKQASMKNFRNEEANEYYVPDWIVNGNIIVEYFGWYIRNNYGKYKLITKYIDKADRKINYFSKLDAYQFLDLYPEDLENDLQGVKDKFSKYGIKLGVK